MNLNLSINKPEAEEADGDVNETKDEIDDCWGGGVMMIIKGRVTLTINIVKMLHAAVADGDDEDDDDDDDNDHDDDDVDKEYG